MEAETLVWNANSRRPLQHKVRRYRIEFDQLKRNLHKAFDNYTTKKYNETLFSTKPKEESANLLKYNTRLSKQNEQLTDATKTLYESDKVSIEIINNLNQQNAQATGTKSKVKTILNSIGESNTIISRMMKREKLVKFALSGIVTIILVAILFILYNKISK